jgi:putative DNA primase/helicase
MDKAIFKYIKEEGFKTTSKDDEANYQFMPGGGDYPWTLKVPKNRIEEFHEKYYELKVKPGFRCNLLEKPMKDKNILKIDIDLRYTPTQDDIIGEKLKHKYNKETIKDFIRIYLNKVNVYLEIPEKAKITIMEKKHPRFVNDDKKYIKDGIHIMSPEIIAPNPVLLAIYNDFIQDEEAIEIFNQFKNSEPIDKAVDSRVIFTNSWYLLGSGKPTDILDYYKPTSTYTIKINENNNIVDIKLKPIKLDISKYEMINYFSNYGKDKCNELKEIVNVEQLEDDLKIGNRNKQKLTKLTDYEKSKYILNIPENHRNKPQVDPQYVFGLLSCLKQSRVEVYEEWLNVACCLYNITPKNWPLFLTWSKKAGEKFSHDGCFMMWYDTLPRYASKYKNLNFDMLKYYAQLDNEHVYINLFKNKKSEFFDTMIQNLIRNKFDKATKDVKFVQFVKEYINLHCPFSLKCADITKTVWYIFRNNRWVMDEGANQVYKLMTRDFLTNFQQRYMQYDEIVQQARTRLQNQQITSLHNNAILSPDMEAVINNISSNISCSSSKDVQNNMRENILGNEETLIETAEKNKNTITQLCEFINKPANRGNIIKDLCHECYDEDFYRNLDNNVYIFICANTVLDLKQCVIRRGQASDMNSIYTNINFPMDVNTELAEECFDELEEFFDKLFPDLDVRDYVLNYYAEALSGEHRREEFAIHTGTGRNGKSVFGNLLKITFGDYYYEPDASIYTSYNADPNSPAPVIANIRGKRITNTQEIKNTKPLETAVIKKMCGGDTINARHLNKSPIQFNPQCKFNMSCNDIPDLDSNDDAIFRRIIVIPYISIFVDANDYRLDDPIKYPNHYPCDTTINTEKLYKWAPYFLYLLWQRYIDLYRENFKQLLPNNRPDAVQEATNEYKKQSNIYSNFMQEFVKFDNTKKLEFQSLYSAFRTYAINIDGKFKPNNQTQKNLHRELAKMGGEKKRENNDWVYYYLSLNGDELSV